MELLVEEQQQNGKPNFNGGLRLGARFKVEVSHFEDVFGVCYRDKFSLINLNISAADFYRILDFFHPEVII